MDDVFLRFTENLVGRVTGPMKFRVLLQPTMAALLAIRSGLKDARAGNAPFLWTIAKDSSARAALLRDGWRSVGKVFLLALALDIVYQIAELRLVYPGEAVVVAFVLAILPYVVLRGFVTRLMSRKKH